MTRSSSCDFEHAAALLEAHPDYRVLRVLPELNRLVLPEPQGKIRTGVVLDVETTSLDAETGCMIELALCPIQFDRRGRIVKIGPVHDWLQDPMQPLSPEIARLTGLTEDDLRGQQIDDTAALELLSSANLLIAHNARFDAAWIERRYPAVAGKPWACSLREVDWGGHGYEARKLGGLLAEVAGWFNQRHRADADVAALVALLSRTLPPGHTVATEMILTAARPTTRLVAIGAPFEVKDQLKERGYRWDPAMRAWWIELSESDAEAERAWLTNDGCCPNPAIRKISWFERHRA